MVENKKHLAGTEWKKISQYSLSPKGHRSREKKEEEVGVGTALNVIIAV